MTRMGMEVALQRKDIIDGVSFELFDEVSWDDNAARRAVISMTDVESGEVITLRSCPNKNKARTSYTKLVKLASV